MNTIVFFVIILSVLIIIGYCNKSGDVVTLDGNLPYTYTDALRGLAMIMILSGHICGRFHESVWFSPFACTGVAIFLFLSGYGNNESFLKKGQFLSTKLLKIAIPYWLLYLILIIVGKCESISFKSILSNLLLWKTDFWFVGYIFKWYVIYLITVNYFYPYRWIIFPIAALLSFFFLTPLESEQSLSFICGVYFSEKKKVIFSSQSKINLIAIILFCFASIALFLKQLPTIRNLDISLRFIQLMIKLPYAVSIIVLLKWIKPLRSNPLLLFLAPLSYELYLVQMPLLDLINTSSTLLLSVTTLSVVFLSILFAYLLHQISNRGFRLFQ